MYIHVKCVKCVFCARRWDMTAAKSTTLSLSQQVLHHILSLIQEPLCLRSEFLGSLKPCKLPEGVFLTPLLTLSRAPFFFWNLWNEKRKQLKRMAPFQAASICEEAAFVPKGALGVWSPNNKNKTPGEAGWTFFTTGESQMLRYILGKQLGNIQMIAEKASLATLSCGVHVFGPVAEQMPLG